MMKTAILCFLGSSLWECASAMVVNDTTTTTGMTMEPIVTTTTATIPDLDTPSPTISASTLSPTLAGTFAGSSPTVSPYPSTFLPTQEYKYPLLRYTVFDQLDEASAEAAMGLGYTETSWNRLGNPELQNEIETKSWYSNNLTSDMFLAWATELDFNEVTWDCYINHYGEYAWEELELYEISPYYEALGWSQEVWDTGDAEVLAFPSSNDKAWADLTDAEKEAAEAVCYMEETWNLLPLTVWKSNNLEASGGGARSMLHGGLLGLSLLMMTGMMA